MVREAVKLFLFKLILHNWPRKLVALVLSVVIWLVVHHSMTETRTFNGVPLRVLNVPAGLTVAGLQPNGCLEKKMNLTLVGNKDLIDQISPHDIEMVVDARNHTEDWIATFTKQNLVSLNPELDLAGRISRVHAPNVPLRMSKLITDYIMVTITRPTGEPPRGYQFLDAWPYHLKLKLTGPDEVIKRLKLREHQLTFNLNNISKADLDALQSADHNSGHDVISYAVPDHWKQLFLPALSENPIPIDDPLAKNLKLEFVRSDAIPIDFPIPVHVHIASELQQEGSPIAFAPSEMLKEDRGVQFFNAPLYACGVDRLFLKTVSGSVELLIIASHQEPPRVAVQFIDPSRLEDRYVAALLQSDMDGKARESKAHLQEEHIRNRFRSYMYHFQLYSQKDKPLQLSPTLKDRTLFL